MPDAKPQIPVPGRFAYEGLERVMHERSRLSILTSLVSHPDGLLFADLKELCNLSDGNLSRQLQTLQDVGLIEIWKGFKNNRPQTRVRLTGDGRKRFLDYVSELERVVSDALHRADAPRSSRSPGVSPA